MPNDEVIKNEKQLKEFLEEKGINVGAEITLSGLQDIIINNFVPLCRKCAFSDFCKFHNISEPPCPILVKVIQNYFQMNFKSLKMKSAYHITEFVKSAINLIEIFNMFENWKGIYFDDHFNWYFESMHPSINEHYGHDILVELSQYLNSYRAVDTGRTKKIVIFLEGDSEENSIPQIFDRLKVFSGVRQNVKYINLQGKDSAQQKKIRDNLTKFKDDDIEYFFILDKDAEEHVQELKDRNLLDDEHVILWENNFEDAFPEEIIYKKLLEINPDEISQLTIEEIKETNADRKDIKRSIGRLCREKKIQFNFNDFKVELAKKLADHVVSEIEESQRVEGGIDNTKEPKCDSCPEIAEKIIPLSKYIKRKFLEFFVV